MSVKMLQQKTRLKNLLKKMGFDRLDRREKLFLSFGAVFIICFLFTQAVIGPYLEAREKLSSSLRSKEKELIEIQLLIKEYHDLKSKQGEIEKRLTEREAGFSLFSFLEEKAAAVRVKERVTSMKPSTKELEAGLLESLVEMKMERMSLDQLVEFLKQVESDDKIVAVRRITIQENTQFTGLLDVVVRIATFTTEKS